MDILSVGELLVDFIGDHYGKSIAETENYTRLLGGSAANLAVNANTIGLDVALVASVGNDGLGQYLLDELDSFGCNTSYVAKISNQPTSLIFISRTDDTPDFIPVRGADAHISELQIKNVIIEKARIFHTSCFALSLEPARSGIMRKAKLAFESGCKLSIDINYATEIWPNSEEAVKFIKAYCAFNPLVKISADDAKRLFGDVDIYNEIFTLFHSYGADTVCLTLGGEGVILAQKGKKSIHKPAIKLNKVVDVTGAGDAFWSGFLYGYIKNHGMEQCVLFGLKIAHIKLQNVGHVPKFTSLSIP